MLRAARRVLLGLGRRPCASLRARARDARARTVGADCPALCLYTHSSKSTLRLRCKCWTTRMCAGASGHPTTNQQRASSPLSARCPCASTRAGTRSSSTSQISRAAPMAPTTLRLCACRSTPTAAFAGSTSRTACTQKTSCRPSSSSSCPCRTSNALGAAVAAGVYIWTHDCM